MVKIQYPIIPPYRTVLSILGLPHLYNVMLCQVTSFLTNNITSTTNPHQIMLNPPISEVQPVINPNWLRHQRHQAPPPHPTCCAPLQQHHRQRRQQCIDPCAQQHQPQHRAGVAEGPRERGLQHLGSAPESNESLEKSRDIPMIMAYYGHMGIEP